MSETTIKQIEKALYDLFMAGRKSMEQEIESKGRYIQLPIKAQLKQATQAITDYIMELMESLSVLETYRDRDGRECFIVPKAELRDKLKGKK